LYPNTNNVSWQQGFKGLNTENTVLLLRKVTRTSQVLRSARMMLCGCHQGCQQQLFLLEAESERLHSLSKELAGVFLCFGLHLFRFAAESERLYSLSKEFASVSLPYWLPSWRACK
jgi:hypothetical protein